VAIRGGVQWLAEAAWGMQRQQAEVVAVCIKGRVQQVEVVCRSGKEDACCSRLGLSLSPWLLWHE